MWEGGQQFQRYGLVEPLCDFQQRCEDDSDHDPVLRRAHEKRAKLHQHVCLSASGLYLMFALAAEGKGEQHASTRVNGVLATACLTLVARPRVVKSGLERYIFHLNSRSGPLVDATSTFELGQAERHSRFMPFAKAVRHSNTSPCWVGFL